MITDDPSVLLRELQNLRIAMEAITERVARSAGLNPRDLSVLDVLHAEGPQTPSALSSRTGIHPATLTAALARLERGGHVARRRSAGDGRSTEIAISDSTVTALTALYAPVDATVLDWIATLGVDERRVIGRFLRELTSATTLRKLPQAYAVRLAGKFGAAET